MSHCEVHPNWSPLRHTFFMSGESLRKSMNARTVGDSARLLGYLRGVLDRDAKSPREDFRRVCNSLQTRNLIGVRTSFVWKS
jgi:hypothetical protein